MCYIWKAFIFCYFFYMQINCNELIKKGDTIALFGCIVARKKKIKSYRNIYDNIQLSLLSSFSIVNHIKINVISPNYVTLYTHARARTHK